MTTPGSESGIKTSASRTLCLVMVLIDVVHSCSYQTTLDNKAHWCHLLPVGGQILNLFLGGSCQPADTGNRRPVPAECRSLIDPSKSSVSSLSSVSRGRFQVGPPIWKGSLLLLFFKKNKNQKIKMIKLPKSQHKQSREKHHQRKRDTGGPESLSSLSSAPTTTAAPSTRPVCRSLSTGFPPGGQSFLSVRSLLSASRRGRKSHLTQGSKLTHLTQVPGQDPCVNRFRREMSANVKKN